MEIRDPIHGPIAVSKAELAVIDSAPRTHPFVSSGDRRGPSDVYEGTGIGRELGQPRDPRLGRCRHGCEPV